MQQRSDPRIGALVRAGATMFCAYENGFSARPIESSLSRSKKQKARLVEADVVALRAIRALAGKSNRTSADQQELWRHEAMLSAQGKTAYLTWPSDRMSAELRRWRPAYHVERTRSGFRVRAWLKGRREYAKRPAATGLDAAGLAPYQHLIRC